MALAWTDSLFTFSWLAKGVNFSACWRSSLILFPVSEWTFKARVQAPGHVSTSLHPPGIPKGFSMMLRAMEERDRPEIHRLLSARWCDRNDTQNKKNSSKAFWFLFCFSNTNSGCGQPLSSKVPTKEKELTEWHSVALTAQLCGHQEDREEDVRKDRSGQGK